MKIFNEFQKTIVAAGVMIAVLGTASGQTYVTPAPATSSSSPIIYPARGQTQSQMERDKADCQAWATQQTGYDPIAAGLQAQQYQTYQQVPQQQYVPPPQSGGVVRGGARGAAAGAALGAIAGNAGKGAAIGAASGGAIGGVRQRQANEAQSQAMAQQQAAQQQ